MSKSLNNLLRKLNLTMEDVKNRRYVVVNTKKQLDIVLNRIMTRETRSALYVNLKQYNGNLSTVTSINSISASSIVKFASCLPKLEIRNENNKRIRSLNGTMEYLTVRFDDTNRIRDLLSKVLNVIVTDNRRCYYFVKSNHGFVCLNDNTVRYEATIENIAESLNGTLYQYISLLPTPAGDKTCTCLFAQIENGNIDAVAEKYNNATCGAYEIFRNQVKQMIEEGKPVDDIVTKMIKAVVRFSAKQAPSINLGQLKGMALLDGYFENNSKELFYSKEVEKREEQLQIGLLKNQIGIEKFQKTSDKLEEAMYEKIKYVKGRVQDGEGIASNMCIAEMIFETFGILIDPDLLVGLVWQVRPATAKISIVILEENCFKQMLKGAKAFGNIITYGDSNKIGLLLDRQGLKMDINPEMFENCTFEVLATAKMSKGKTSKQILRIAFYYAQNPDYIVNLCNEAMESVILDKEHVIRNINNEPKRTLLSEVDATLKSNYYDMLELKYNPDLINESPSFFKGTYRQTISSHINDIDGVNIPLNIENRRMVADLSFLITGNKVNGLLKMNECYINNPDREHIIFFKYPLQGLEEYYSLENSIGSLENRINALFDNGTIDADEKEALISFFTTISEKVIILPPSLHLMHTCAGSDFDYDGGAVLYSVKSEDNPTDKLSNHLFNLFKNNFKFKGVDIL